MLPDGSQRIIHTENSEFVSDENDQLVVLTGITQDITIRKQAESALIESESHFKNMFIHHNTIMWLIEPETGRIINANIAASKFYGYTITELCAMSIFDINTLPQANTRSNLKDAAKIQRNYYIFKHKLASGDLRDVEIHTSPIDFEGKNVLFSIIHDITERKLMKDDLFQSNQKLEAIISASPDGIGMASLDGELQLVSDKLAEMVGYSNLKKEEYEGKTIFDFVDPSNRDSLKENIHLLLSESGNHRMAEYLGLKKDGSEFDADVNSSVFFDLNGKPESILFIERDITDRKKSEESLKKAATRLS